MSATDMDARVVRELFAEADAVLTRLRAGYDEIDVGLVLCFALVRHKPDEVSEEDFLGLIRKTLQKALVAVGEL